MLETQIEQKIGTGGLLGSRGIVDVGLAIVGLDEHDVEMDRLMHPSNRLGSTSWPEEVTVEPEWSYQFQL